MPTGQADRLMPTLRRVVLAQQSAARSDGELLGAFVTSRDSDAFTELVRRHGSMVLGVCRRLVGDRGTADDAFQATFLVLARRAAAVRPREQVGNWLYGVAYRTALKARMVLARRRSREKQVDVMPEPTAPASAPNSIDWTDLLPVIDEELARLPDKLRVPVVLCDLEGRPQREVAKHLNVPPATLATRLASARRTLAQRLTRRGVTLSGGALATMLGTHATSHAVPPALAAGLARAAEAVATGGAVTTLVSANAVHLSEGVMRMMMLAKLKAVAVTAVTVLALTTGLGLGLVPATAGDQPTEPGTPKPKLAPHESFAARPAAKPQERPEPAPAPDDATFLRRLSLDVRGTLPTVVEMWFFISDEDADKRAKLVQWLTADDEVKARLAKKLGVPVERVKVLRVRLAPDGKTLTVVTDEKDAVKADVLLALRGGGQEFAILADGSVRREAAIVWEHLAENKTALDALAEWAYAGEDTDEAKKRATARLHTLKRAVWDPKTGKQIVAGDTLYLADVDGDGVIKWFLVDGTVRTAPGDSDAEFLKRVLTDVRGNGPTALELRYFTEDKDPKKREKLLDTLLKDPAVQKKLGDAWKAKMLSFKMERLDIEIFRYPPERLYPHELRFDVKPLPPQPPAPPAIKPPQPVTPPVPPTPAAPQPSKFEKLVDELIAAKKSDAEILEALTLAALSRLPTDNEKKIVLASIGTVTDRKAAWVAVAKALAGSTDTKKVERDMLKLWIEQGAPPTPPTPPVPPTKP